MNDGFPIEASFTSRRDHSPIYILEAFKRMLVTLKDKATALDAELRLDRLYFDTIPRGNDETLYIVRTVVHEREGITGTKEFSD